MKAYFIGGPNDQHKMIVSDDFPRTQLVAEFPSLIVGAPTEYMPKECVITNHVYRGVKVWLKATDEDVVIYLHEADGGRR